VPCCRPAARAMDVGDKVATVRCASQGTEHFETTANVTALQSIAAVSQSRDYHVWRLLCGAAHAAVSHGSMACACWRCSCCRRVYCTAAIGGMCTAAGGTVRSPRRRLQSYSIGPCAVHVTLHPCMTQPRGKDRV